MFDMYGRSNDLPSMSSNSVMPTSRIGIQPDTITLSDKPGRGAAALVAALIYVSVSRAAAIKCLSCSRAARPRDCEYVQECGAHEKCSVQSILTTSGYTIYSVGCTDIHKCTSFGKRRAIINATDLQEIQHKNEFVAIPDGQWDQDIKDFLLCAECCDTELCNVKGCGEEGLPADSGPVCYGCQQERDPDQCNQIVLCGRDDACRLSPELIGVDQVYKSGCIPRQFCQQLGHLDPGANGLIVRRQRDVDMLTILKRASFCNKCCTENLCNIGNCSLVHPTNTFPPLTHPTTVQAVLTPVDGNWSEWGHWSVCSATCGSSVTRSRSRTCTNPAPSMGGTDCKGIAAESDPCILDACPVDGNWSEWGHWSECTATCGSSVTRSRSRTCTNPAPSLRGANCLGTASDAESCNLGACPGPETCPVGFETCHDGKCEPFHFLCEEHSETNPAISIIG